jgi:hypothetical protein
MVGGVFSQCLTATGNPATENTENNTRDGQNHEDEKNRLGFIEVEQLPHPSNHLGKELTDLGKQSSDNRSSSALKSSSFHKNIYGTCHGRNRRTNKEKIAAKIMK